MLAAPGRQAPEFGDGPWEAVGWGGAMLSALGRALAARAGAAGTGAAGAGRLGAVAGRAGSPLRPPAAPGPGLGLPAGASRGLAIRYNRKKSKQRAAAEESRELRGGRAIKAPEVRLVGPNGHEVLRLAEALKRAEEAGLDLVEVNPKASPPVCRVMDHRRELYVKRKKEKERIREKGGAGAGAGERKEVRMRATIAAGDYEMKLAQMERFLERGSRVRLRIFKGQPEEMRGLAERIVARLGDAARAENELRVESGYGSLTFAPRPPAPAPPAA